jgi:hypothetical protein
MQCKHCRKQIERASEVYRRKGWAVPDFLPPFRHVEDQMLSCMDEHGGLQDAQGNFLQAEAEETDEGI